MIRKNLILVIFLLLSLSLYGQKSSMKVISYNILNGFDWGKDTSREAKLASWISKQKPDVVALQELCGFTQEKLEQFAKTWGHDYAVILKTEGYPVGLSSSKPIELKEKLQEDLWHGMLHCKTWNTDFFIVHLSPSDWRFRKQEAEIIIQRIEKSCTETDPYIVLGDFNAVSPFDHDFNLKNPYQLERMRKSDEKSKKYKNLRDWDFDYSVISRFLSVPLTDVCLKFIDPNKRTTCPSPINVPKWLSEEEMKITKSRIDYILASSPLATKCISAKIYNDDENYYLSDHYPVMAEFDLSIPSKKSNFNNKNSKK